MFSWFNVIINNFSENTDKLLTFNVPSHSSGIISIYINATGGNTELNNCFTYIPYPTITSIIPNYGQLLGGNKIDIFGTNLDNTTSLYIGSNLSQINSNNSSLLSINTPSNISAETVSVRINTIGGSFTYNSSYTYIPDPSITSYEIIDSVTININGTNLINSNVSINNIQTTINTNTNTLVNLTLPSNLVVNDIIILSNDGGKISFTITNITPATYLITTIEVTNLII